MARARSRQRSKIVQPVQKQKSLWKRVFGQTEGEELDMESPEAQRLPPTSSRGSGRGGGGGGGRASQSTLESKLTRHARAKAKDMR